MSEGCYGEDESRGCAHAITAYVEASIRDLTAGERVALLDFVRETVQQAVFDTIIHENLQ